MFSFEQWLALRKRCVEDLFFLASDVLGMSLIEMHRQVTDFTVRKKRRVPISDLSPVKRRLVLCSRGLYKSSIISVAESIQWLLFDPNLRVGIDADALDLSTGLVEQVKQRFALNFDLQGNPVPTLLQILWPEYCAKESALGPVGEMWSPARTNHALKEPNVFAISLGKATSGTHCEILYLDDAESNQNSGVTASEEQRQSVYQQIQADEMLADHYTTILGTPHSDADAYTRIEDDGTATLRIPAWELRPSGIGKKAHELLPEDVDLNFEYDSNGVLRLPFDKLIREARSDWDFFSKNRLVSCGPNLRITEALVRQHILPAQVWEPLMWRPREVVACWDLAYLSNTASASPHSRSRDWNVGCCGSFDENAGVLVQDIQRGRWTATEIAQAMTLQCMRHRVGIVLVEDTYLDWIMPTLRAALQSAGCHTVRIAGITRSSEPGLKQQRLTTIASALHDERRESSIWFSPQIPPDIMDVVVRELTKARIGSNQHDDVRDSLGHLLQQLQQRKNANAIGEDDPQATMQERFQKALENAQLSEHVYGKRSWDLGDPPPPPREPEPEPFDINKIPPGSIFIN